jgi:hypothetical protein
MTPLSQKLQMKPGQTWLLYNAPDDYLSNLHPLPKNLTCTFLPNGNFDGIQLFARNKAELKLALQIIIPLLGPDTIFWVSYPKRSSGIESDLKMEEWQELYALNLQGVSSISVDKIWAGSRFRPRGQAKNTGTGNNEIRKSGYAEFINVDTKTIRLPPDVERLFKQHPRAHQYFDQLSYSNKKEYLLWILSAKQEKTRAERLVKMGEKLSAGKKNPAQK